MTVFPEEYQNVFIDESLQNDSDYIISSIEGIKKLLQDNFYFFFLTENKSTKIFEKIDEIRITNKFDDKESIKTFQNLQTHLKKTTTSFSWGYVEIEFIFIIVNPEEDGLFAQPPALIGLLIHELLHSMERQRG